MHDLALLLARLPHVRQLWTLPINLGLVSLGLLAALLVITTAAALGVPQALWRRRRADKKKPARGGFFIQALGPEELV